MNRAVRNGGNGTVADIGEDVPTLGIIVVGIQVRILVVLNAEIVPADAEVKGQAVRCLPGVLKIATKFMVPITPGERWLSDGKCDGAGRNRAGRAAGELALGIDSSLKLTEIAVDEVLKARPEIAGAEGFHSFFVRAESTIVADVGVIAAEAERVPAMNRTEILIGLHKVLWAAKWNRISRRERRVAGHPNQLIINSRGRCSIHI